MHEIYCKHLPCGGMPHIIIISEKKVFFIKLKVVAKIFCWDKTSKHYMYSHNFEWTCNALCGIIFNSNDGGSFLDSTCESSVLILGTTAAVTSIPCFLEKSSLYICSTFNHERRIASEGHPINIRHMYCIWIFTLS